MDVAMDLYLAVPLLFTALAIVLASVFVRLRRGEGERAAATERPREPAAAAAEPDQEGEEGPAAGPEEKRGRGPVEELGTGDEGKEAAGEKQETAAEPDPEAEPSAATPRSSPREDPAESSPRGVPVESIPLGGPAESSPRGVPVESIPLGGPAESSARGVPVESSPRQPPAEPRQPEPRDDAESTMPPLLASSGSSLGHTEQMEDECGPTALPNTAEEEDLDSKNEKLVVREPEDEDAADEMFSFKYSPGKLRGNQYKSMMTKEELEEEQRTEDYMKLSLTSS